MSACPARWPPTTSGIARPAEWLLNQELKCGRSRPLICICPYLLLPFHTRRTLQAVQALQQVSCTMALLNAEKEENAEDLRRWPVPS